MALEQDTDVHVGKVRLVMGRYVSTQLSEIVLFS